MSTPLGDIDLAVGQKYYILPRIKSKDKTLHGTRPEQGQIHRIQPRLLSWTHHLLEPMQASQWLMNLFPYIPSSHCSWSRHLWFHLCVSPRSNSRQSCCHLCKHWDFADGTMSIFHLSLLRVRCQFGVPRASMLQKLEINSGLGNYIGNTSWQAWPSLVLNPAYSISLLSVCLGEELLYLGQSLCKDPQSQRPNWPAGVRKWFLD